MTSDRFIQTLEQRRLLTHGGSQTHDRDGVRDPFDTASLTAAHVELILAQAASQALPGQGVVVVDREGVVLGMWGGSGLNDDRFRDPRNGAIFTAGFPGEEADLVIRKASEKARTAAFFASNENAFTPRTARFIIQDHFPQPIKNTPGGPLYGVQFSSFRGNDVNRPDQVGFPTISGDPGGIPLYLNGIAVGGVGVAGDARDVVARLELLPISLPGSVVPANKRAKNNPRDNPLVFKGREEKDFDEAVALAGARGFDTPARIRATRVFVDGLRFPFIKDKRARRNATRSLAELAAAGAGSLRANEYLRNGSTSAEIIGSPTEIGGISPFATDDPTTTFDNTPFTRTVFGDINGENGVSGLLKTQFRVDKAARTLRPVADVFNPDPNAVIADPFSDQVIPSDDTGTGGALLPESQRLTRADVIRILDNGVFRANNTRALIREPDGVPMKVHLAVVDRDGDLLGVFRMQDGPNFGYDVSIQKARTSAFFSDDTHAFTDRALGFMSQKLFPIGIDDGTVAGPLYNLQDRLFLKSFDNDLDVAQNFDVVADDGSINPLRNGITIFPGSVPLYKNGVLVGGIGISGDGVDQDEIVAYEGSAGFRPTLADGQGGVPAKVRSDRLGDDEVVSFILGRVQRMTELFDLSFLPQPGQRGENPVLESQLVGQAQRRFDVGFHDFRLPWLRLPRNSQLVTDLDNAE